MGVLDALRDDDLERGTLLSPTFPSSADPAPSSSSSAVSSTSNPSARHALSSVASRIFWTVAFYAPSAALPLAARLLVVYRDEAVVGLASLARGAAFGCLQDAAVFFQSLVVARVVLAGRDALLTSRACCRNALVYTTAALALALAYLWMTLACLVDLSLLLNYLPRLNRGFVAMYLHFAAQFASSLQDAVTANMVLGFVLYVSSMALWTAAVLLDKVQVPTFGLPAFCQPAHRRTAAAAPRNGDTKQGANAATRSAPQRKVPTIASVGIFSWTLHALLTSLTLRTLCVALMVSVSALHATLSLDGNGSDIHFLSNAMFSLEAEDFLKTAQAMQLSSGTGDASAAARVLSFQPCLERVIGPTESYLPADGGLHRDKYPLWRKTLAFKGEKRFEVRTHRSKPPNVILLNLESMRSREIGVIGGRENKARFNQTVTPFFDELSKTGVLFREHYTPSIQTSRTLLSSLFGVLPSLTDESAVNKAFKTPLRLHGLPQILKEALHYTTMFWSAVDLAWDHWREFFETHGFDQLVDEKGVLEHLSQARRDTLKANDRFSWGIHDPVSFEALENFLEAHRVNERSGPPLFLDVYSITSHDPFPAPPNFTASSNYSTFVTKDNKGYLDTLNFVDQQLGRLITNLRAKKLLDNTIVLIEGDHGYGRMEHGNNPTIASSKVYEEATHIPLLILADDLLREQDKGLVVDDVSSQADLLATVADMLGLRGFMQHGVGQSLMRKPPAPQQPDDPALPRGVVLENPYDGRTIGVRVGRDLKYVRFGSGKFSVFNLTSDPREVAPVETGHVDKGFRNATTEMFIRYASQVVDMTQFMYEADAFVAPPLRKKVEAAQAKDKPLSAAPKKAAQ